MADCKIPEIPFASGVDQNLQRLLAPIKETLDIWAGRIGSPLCRHVTIEDLLDEAITVNIAGGGGSTGLFVRRSGDTMTGDLVMSNALIDTKQYTTESGFPNRTDTTISFVDGTRTFTITPVGASFDFWAGGSRFVKTAADSVVIPDTEGTHFIYYDGTGTLMCSTSFSTLLMSDYTWIANIHWDATNNEAILFGEERHDRIMSSDTHIHLHLSYGTAFVSGLLLTNFDEDGSGADDTAAQLSCDNGIIRDEDIQHDIIDGSPQDLSPILNAPIYYRLGAAGDWRRIAATAFPVTITGTGRLAWNEFTGGAWQLTEVTNNSFANIHVIATADINEPIIVIMGQAEYGNVNAARAGAETEIQNLSLGSMSELSLEWKAIATVIYQTSNTYANTVQSRVRSADPADSIIYVDWRRTSVGAGGSGAGDYAPVNHTHTESDIIDLQTYWDRTGTVLSPKTAGDDIKVSGVTILDAAPILVFQDSNGAGAASTGFIEWKDSGGGRAGYFGNASSGDDDLSWGNEQGGHIKIITTGAGELQVSAPLNMNTHKVLGVADPTLDQDAATKKYVDDNGGLFSEDADDNIVGGTNAGSELSTGANNFYGGVAAGRYGDGSYNVGIGSQALEGTIANNFAQNIGIGRQAGVALTTGSNNVFLGYIAGSIVTTGVGNTLLGAAAGTNITTSGNNIVIGAGMLPLSATVWRQFALGVGGYPFLRGDMTNYQLAIYGADGYLNFNTTLGSTGYGIRDSSGVMEFKDSGGSWQVIGAGSHTIASHSDTTATGTELEALTDNSIVDALHRHSELSASDGSPDAVVRVDTDGMLIVDAIGTGLDVLHSATIGNHLDVGDNLTVDTNTLFVDSTTHRVGIGTTSPSQKLEIVGAAGVNVYPKVTSAATSKDSAFWFHDSTYSVFCGLLGTTTGVTDGDFVIYAGATRMVVRQSDGNVGIGTTAPTSKLHVVGLPAYANNAAAVTGGLTAGAFYRTNGDPDLVCVVH